MTDRIEEVARERVEQWSAEGTIEVYRGEAPARDLADLIRAQYQRGAVDASRRPGPNDYDPDAGRFLIGLEKTRQARRVMAALAGEEVGDD